MNNKFWATSLCVMAGILISACGGEVPLKPSELAKSLEKEGWTYSDLPRELLGPGSIVSITDSSGISYRGNITECIDDPQVTEVVSGAAGIPDFNVSYELKVGAMLDYHNVKIGPKLSTVKKVSFKIGELEEEALSSIRVEEWLEANMDSLSGTCKRYLRGNGARERADLRGSVFVLIDVLKVTGYEYTFSGDNNASINLSESTLKDYLTLSADVSYSVTRSGSLKIDSPVYIAFKESIFLAPTSGQGATFVDGAEASAILNRRLRLASE